MIPRLHRRPSTNLQALLNLQAHDIDVLNVAIQLLKKRVHDLETRDRIPTSGRDHEPTDSEELANIIAKMEERIEKLTDDITDIKAAIDEREEENNTDRENATAFTNKLLEQFYEVRVNHESRLDVLEATLIQSTSQETGRTIDQIEQLDKLPVGSVIRDKEGDIWFKGNERDWMPQDVLCDYTTQEVFAYAPLSLIYENKGTE